MAINRGGFSIVLKFDSIVRHQRGKILRCKPASFLSHSDPGQNQIVFCILHFLLRKIYFSNLYFWAPRSVHLVQIYPHGAGTVFLPKNTATVNRLPSQNYSHIQFLTPDLHKDESLAVHSSRERERAHSGMPLQCKCEDVNKLK